MDAAKPLVLVLDERPTDAGRAFDDLEPYFPVKRIVSVIGCNGKEAELAGVVLHLNGPEQRAATLIGLLRGQRGCEGVPIFVLAPGTLVQSVSQVLKGLSGVEVIDTARAFLHLRARIEAAVRPSRVSQPYISPVAGTPHERLQKRFLVHSAERGQRALALCDELEGKHLSPARRAALLEEVKDLLNMMKGEATMLRLRAVAEVLTTAETVVAKLDQSPATFTLPTGVLGLFSDLAALNESGASLGSFDANRHLHRLSLEGGHTA